MLLVIGDNVSLIGDKAFSTIATYSVTLHRYSTPLSTVY